MNIFKRLQEYFDSLDYTGFLKVIGIYASILTLIVGGLLYWKSYKMEILTESLDDLNSKREEIKKLLTSYKALEQEQKNVDSIITKDPDFNLAAYFENLLQSFKVKQSKKVAIISRATKANNYIEEIASADLVEIDMKTLTEIIQELDSNNRITIQKLDITKTMATTVNVSIDVATLLKKSA